jgi:membrane-associated HD superfamily phosphohydrolase
VHHTYVRIYPFNWFPTYENRFLLGELIFFGLLLILFFALKIKEEKNIKKSPARKELFDQIFSLLSTCVTLGFVLIFLQWQSIPYLSASLFIIILSIIMIIWSSIIFAYFNKVFKNNITSEENRLKFEKYLPRAKEEMNRSKFLPKIKEEKPAKDSMQPLLTKWVT